MFSTILVERTGYMSWTPQRPNTQVPYLWAGVKDHASRLRQKVPADLNLQGRAAEEGH